MTESSNSTHSDKMSEAQRVYIILVLSTLFVLAVTAIIACVNFASFN